MTQVIPAEPWAVVALILHPHRPVSSREQLILSISRRGKPDDIGFPGGKVDPGETPKQALARELLEEMTITASPESMVPIFERVDATVMRYSRCYWVREWDAPWKLTEWKTPKENPVGLYSFTTPSGQPQAAEEGFVGRWSTVDELIAKTNTFGAFNEHLFMVYGYRDATFSDSQCVRVEDPVTGEQFYRYVHRELA